MNNPLLSVVIPFYNRVDWLCEAIESVLNQTYDNLEIIVVNDGSPEDVSDFLERYGDKIIYRYKENGGAATARNLAMEIATGEYIAFLDSDDIWLPEKTEKQIAFMRRSGTLWSHTGFFYWIPETNRIRSAKNKYNYDNVYEKIYISVRIATPSVIINKKILEEHPEINFPIEYRKAQDVKFFHALSRYYPLGLLQEPLVKVRMRGDNSNMQAIMRFNLRASEYLKNRGNKDVPKYVQGVSYIYYLYSKMFGKATNAVKEFLALIFWSLPFSIERLILMLKFNKDKHKNPKYRE